MKIDTSFALIPAFAITVWTMTGCAITQGQQNDNALTTSNSGVISHTVVPGDQLGEIASRYTGRVSLWEEIAELNNIEDPRTLRAGDIIEIPQSLITPNEKSNTPAGAPNSEGPLIAASNTLGTLGTTTAASLGLKRDAASTIIEPDIVVNSVHINRTFELNPLDQTSGLEEHAGDDKTPHVKVIGTYYPKGIYQQPASYSALLARVAPGTVFVLEREINDWYKIITDQGVGYLRAIDGKIITE